MWIIKKGKRVFMCTSDDCENTEHFAIEKQGLFLVLICTICKEEYANYEVDE